MWGCGWAVGRVNGGWLVVVGGWWWLVAVGGWWCSAVHGVCMAGTHLDVLHQLEPHHRVFLHAGLRRRERRHDECLHGVGCPRPPARGWVIIIIIIILIVHRIAITQWESATTSDRIASTNQYPESMGAKGTACAGRNSADNRGRDGTPKIETKTETETETETMSKLPQVPTCLSASVGLVIASTWTARHGRAGSGAATAGAGLGPQGGPGGGSAVAGGAWTWGLGWAGAGAGSRAGRSPRSMTSGLGCRPPLVHAAPMVAAASRCNSLAWSGLV